MGFFGLKNAISGLWGGPLIALIGGGILFLGIQWRANTQAFVASAARAEGRVVELAVETRVEEGQEKRLFYPVVEFTTEDGRVIRFREGTGSNPPSHQVGDTVQVLYNPQVPEDARLEGWSLWIGPTLVLAFGTLFIFLGAIAFLQSLLVVLGLGGLLGVLAFLLLRRRARP
ncbi:MAG: DUF3592 domain-containing protein [Anaerolineae bacterium]|nr:DUF3592 domain-containing protein [Anaerolineae bacterium]MDW8101025.1 DUF3592 domain-containing protein [Anaerolineae bacterium]